MIGCRALSAAFCASSHTASQVSQAVNSGVLAGFHDLPGGVLILPRTARGRCDKARSRRSSHAQESRCPHLLGARASVPADAPCALGSATVHCRLATHHGPAALQPRPLRGGCRLSPRPCGRSLCQSQVSRSRDTEMERTAGLSLPSRAMDAATPAPCPRASTRTHPHSPVSPRESLPRG